MTTTSQDTQPPQGMSSQTQTSGTLSHRNFTYNGVYVGAAIPRLEDQFSIEYEDLFYQESRIGFHLDPQHHQRRPTARMTP